MTPNQSDPVFEEVRELRHRISERFDHDPTRLVAYYTELQRQHRDRLIHLVEPPEHADPSAA